MERREAFAARAKARAERKEKHSFLLAGLRSDIGTMRSKISKINGITDTVVTADNRSGLDDASKLELKTELHTSEANDVSATETAAVISTSDMITHNNADLCSITSNDISPTYNNNTTDTTSMQTTAPIDKRKHSVHAPNSDSSSPVITDESMIIVGAHLKAEHAAFAEAAQGVHASYDNLIGCIPKSNQLNLGSDDTDAEKLKGGLELKIALEKCKQAGLDELLAATIKMGCGADSEECIHYRSLLVDSHMRLIQLNGELQGSTGVSYFDRDAYNDYKSQAKDIDLDFSGITDEVDKVMAAALSELGYLDELTTENRESLEVEVQDSNPNDNVHDEEIMNMQDCETTTSFFNKESNFTGLLEQQEIGCNSKTETTKESYTEDMILPCVNPISSSTAADGIRCLKIENSIEVAPPNDSQESNVSFVITNSDKINNAVDGENSRDRGVYLDVRVGDPQDHSSIRGKYTDYAIIVRTNFFMFSLAESTTRRRYSEFEFLREYLSRPSGERVLPVPPKLPEKYVMNRFDSATVETRRKGLEDFLLAVVSTPEFLVSPALIAFLQTDLSVSSLSSLEPVDTVPADVISRGRGLLKIAGFSVNVTHRAVDNTDKKYFSHLPVRRLMELLASFGISSDGCIEKSDLITRLMRHLTTINHDMSDFDFEKSVGTSPAPENDEYGGLTNDVVDLTFSTKRKVALWDPVPVLHGIYSDVNHESFAMKAKLKNDHVTNYAVSISGYVEKMARGQRKITLIKTWKRRWFSLRDATLFYSESDTSKKSLGFVKLASAHVAVGPGGNTLDVINSGERALSMRFSGPEHLNEWRSALVAAIAETRKKRSKKAADAEEKTSCVAGQTNAIIIDAGSADVKAGYARGPSTCWPEIYFPNRVGVHRSDEEYHCVGFDCLCPAERANLFTTSPLNANSVYDWDAMEDIYSACFLQLGADTATSPIVLTAPSHNTLDNQKRMAEIMFETFGVPSLYIQRQSVLSMFSAGQITGLAVNIGDSVEITPLNQGFVVHKGTRHLPYGGATITNYLSRLLAQDGYRMFSEIEGVVARHLKERLAYVALDYETELANVERNSFSATAALDLSRFNLPDGTTTLSVDSSRFTATECLFQPQMVGRDNIGLHHAVSESIGSCGIDVRKEMAANIHLSGGTSLITGLADRLKREVEYLLPGNASARVVTSDSRKFSAFLGGAVVSRLQTFDQMCVWNEDYMEEGAHAVISSANW